MFRLWVDILLIAGMAELRTDNPVFYDRRCGATLQQYGQSLGTKRLRSYNLASEPWRRHRSLIVGITNDVFTAVAASHINYNIYTKK